MPVPYHLDESDSDSIVSLKVSSDILFFSNCQTWVSSILSKDMILIHHALSIVLSHVTLEHEIFPARDQLNTTDLGKNLIISVFFLSAIIEA